MTTEERNEALEAARILQSDVFRSAFERLDAKYVSEWRAAETTDDRERCWMMIRTLSRVKSEIMDVIECAAVAERGKDRELLAAMNAAKEGMNG